MQRFDRNAAAVWLGRHGVPSGKWLSDILGGFDFGHPVYEQHFFQGDVLFQYVRNPQVGAEVSARGSWFGLRGVERSGLAITDGLSGRHLHKFKVQLNLVALEGVAAPKAVDWSWAGGGEGGATQIFVPPSQIARIRAVAHTEEW